MLLLSLDKINEKCITGLIGEEKRKEVLEHTRVHLIVNCNSFFESVWLWWL
jgi:hypothetical protein